MQIGIASYFYPRGGSAYSVRAITEGLLQRGVDVQLVSGSLSSGAPGQTAANFYGKRLTLMHDYTQANTEWEQGYDPMAGSIPMHGSFERKAGVPDRDFAEIPPVLARLQIDAWVQTLASLPRRCDLLHLNHLTPMTIAARELWPEVPIVTTLHGTELKWLARERRKSGNHRYWSELMTRAASVSDVLIVLNREDENAARDLLGPEATRRIEVIGGGVNVHQFRPTTDSARTSEASRIAPRETHFICVARFIAAKRIPLLLRAWQIAEQTHGLDAHLTIVGGNSAEVEGEDPIMLARHLGLRRVTFAPPVTQHELAILLRSADIFVLPSVNESFGQVFFEALASGIPVVACRSGAPGELLASQYPPVGWFCDPDQTYSLANSLVQAATDPVERRRRSVAGRRLIVGRFSWDEVVERLLGLYDSQLRSTP